MSRVPGYTGFIPRDQRDNQQFAEPAALKNHIPGYKGYVPGIAAENVYARTFGRTTHDSLDNRIVRDNGQHRYNSTNQDTYFNQTTTELWAKAETNPFLLEDTNQKIPVRKIPQPEGTLTMSYEEAMQAAMKKNQ